MEDVCILHIWPCGQFSGYLLYFVAIWYGYGYLVYFSRFGMLYQVKSGNPSSVDDACKKKLDPKPPSCVRIPKRSLTRKSRDQYLTTRACPWG
jgi:hypothetical protein